MSPFTWEDLARKARMIRAYRSWAVSAYMKAVRLQRAGDAMYWLAVLVKARAGTGYITRRVFSSAAEDNCDVPILEHCEELYVRMETELQPLWFGAYLSALGTKWYELPDGQIYTHERCDATTATHGTKLVTAAELHDRYRAALTARNVRDAYWCIREGQVVGIHMHPFYRIAGELAADQGSDELTRRLGRMLVRNVGWLGASREKNHLWQCVWAWCKGPLETVGRVPDAKEFAALSSEVKKRLAAELEAVPGWALDGIHTGGSDPRFAGSVEGCLNMIEMFKRYGRVDPRDPGILVREGQKMPRVWKPKPKGRR